jgi:hypothetical protein
MASVRKQILIDAEPADVWDALRDWGQLHERLVPGFVVACELDGPDRIVTFFNGAVARERLVTCDDASRRLVWTIVDGPYEHHNGVAQVIDGGDGTTRFLWTADLLPDAAAGRTSEMMDHGLAAIAETLGREE